jgi:hypothetical protein
MDDDERVTQLHHVFHHHFDEIGSGSFKFHIAENHHADRGVRRVFQFKFHFALADDRGLVGRDEARAFVELADARRPAVEDADAAGDDGNLRHADDVDDADKEKISVRFLTDFLADERALEIGENSGGLHEKFLVLDFKFSV